MVGSACSSHTYLSALCTQGQSGMPLQCLRGRTIGNGGLVAMNVRRPQYACMSQDLNL